MPHSHCVRCATCDGFPCLVHAKSDAEVLGVRPALEHAERHADHRRRGRSVSRRARTAARSPASSSSRPGERETFSGDIVVVSCGAANSARLLLASANDAHPDGLANGSGQVGRNYMFHNSQAVLALSKDPNPTVFQKTLGVNDFYFGAPDFDFPLGNIQMVGKSSADMYRGEKPLQTRLAPQRTLDASPGTRSTSGSRRRTCRGPRTVSRCARTGRSGSATRPATRSPSSGCCTSSSRCSATSACITTTWSRATPTSRTRSRWRAARIRPAPAGSEPIPRPRS